MYKIWLFENYDDSNEYCDLIDEGWYSSFNKYPNFIIQNEEDNKDQIEEKKMNREQRMKIFKPLKRRFKVIPCCYDHEHWMLAVWDSFSNQLYIMDSLNQTDKHDCLIYLLQNNQSIQKKLETHFIKVDYQKDSWTCGYRMVQWISHIIFSKSEELDFNEITKLSSNEMKQLYFDMSMYYQIQKEIEEFIKGKYEEDTFRHELLENIKWKTIDEQYIYLKTNGFIYYEDDSCHLYISD